VSKVKEGLLNPSLQWSNPRPIAERLKPFQHLCASNGWKRILSDVKGRRVVNSMKETNRSLSAGVLAEISVWHNHRVAPRGVHQGLSTLQRSDLTKGANDWLVALGYPPVPGLQLPTILQYEEGVVV
jgi:hypothetical protein